MNPNYFQIRVASSDDSLELVCTICNETVTKYKGWAPFARLNEHAEEHAAATGHGAR